MHRFLAAMSLAMLIAIPLSAEDKPAAKKPKGFTIGKETTYVDGPLDKDGYIDYAAALNERLGKGVTAENNANVLIWKALGPRPEGGRDMTAEFFKYMGMDRPPEKGEYFVDFGRYAQDVLKLPPGEDLQKLEALRSRLAKRAWTSKESPEIAGWLKANEKPLAIIHEASKRSRYFMPLVPTKSEKDSLGLIGAPLPSAQKTRGLAAALTARAMLHLGEGRVDDAWRDLLTCHRLARLVGRGGCLIEGL